MKTFEAIEVEREEGVATIAFNRPASMNSIVPQMLREFEDCMAEFAADPSVEVVILTRPRAEFLCRAGCRHAEAARR